ncbi:Phosphate transporter PHO1-like protein 9 [Hibiscus syriacus]|uniref:Phosphate transporter PHO1-like protein 9 n=1 Tax=Hibiscus syriacus TaxID=106335 RepID=A0A6A3CL86_HIBSY|nr:Phosphate transporter PHO1-like protein 9 [Hibiscus syriacus]
MKFGKEFAAQMVQEWKEAYMDYSNLKSILKDILRFKQQNKPPTTMATGTRKGSLKRTVTLYRAFSGLTNKYKPVSSMKNHEDEVILVSAVQEGGVEGDYQTMFLRSGEEGGEFEMLFFRRLDDEFNKIVRLIIQLWEELIWLILLIMGFLQIVISGSFHQWGKHGRARMDATEMSSDGISVEEMKEAANRHIRPPPLHVLDHVKIKVELETPIETLRSVIKSSKSDFSFSKQELRSAEEKISQALVEFYRKFRLLKSYCFLNQLAFSKIMKKYDNVSSRNASKSYLQMVDKSYLGSSDERYRVNYSVIFGFEQGTELGYREVLLLSSGLSLLALAGVISHLDMEIDPRTKSFRTLTELIPLCAFHCVCAPLYKVTLPDFFLADQFTSQVQAIRSLEFYICYYGWGNFRVRSNTCEKSEVYKVVYIVVAVIPYWIRFVQCLRRLFEEKDVSHGLNGLKYFSTISAVATRTIYQNRAEKTTWLVLAAATSGVATMASLYWDIVIDWGLLNRNSTNPWLRDKLAVPHKGVYYIAMVLNCVLRLAWTQQVLGIQTVPFLHKSALVAVVASLEIIRRGVWNFFRLENERLNNVGKYRAFKSVPLPFYYDKNGDKSI